jgi:hypothetical protein
MNVTVGASSSAARECQTQCKKQELASSEAALSYSFAVSA